MDSRNPELTRGLTYGLTYGLTRRLCFRVVRQRISAAPVAPVCFLRAHLSACTLLFAHRRNVGFLAINFGGPQDPLIVRVNREVEQYVVRQML